MNTVYVVIWDCNWPKAMGVFDVSSDAHAYAAFCKSELDAFFKRIGLTGDERVYVAESKMNPVIEGH